MRSAGNFSPEWGYLAPAPSFMRTARVVLVATAVGATAGAAVVLSLVDRPASDSEKSVVAAHAAVTSVEAATAMPPVAAVAPATAITNSPAAAPVPARTPPRAVMAPRSAATVAPLSANNPAVNAGAAEAATVPPQQSPSGMAALSEAPPAGDAAASDLPDGTTLAPAGVTPAKKPPKNAGAASARNQLAPGIGAVLRRVFSANTGTSYYPNR